jgi:hypothetical protein
MIMWSGTASTTCSISATTWWFLTTNLVGSARMYSYSGSVSSTRSVQVTSEHSQKNAYLCASSPCDSAFSLIRSLTSRKKSSFRA